jgi:TPR repeat protein
MYEQGWGVPSDVQRAFALYLRAAERGESSALKSYRTAASLAGEIASCAELSEAIEYGRAHSNND